ncbi:MAG: enoyl-CoA hydratase/isomerase family protein [Planctomycetes bacterium]|nr:enoyl-CoA hydratase/isomerase family protein [Planctomycetota bacterium]
MGDLVELEKANGIATVTLTNAPANGYSYAMMRELDEAILDVRMDESVHAIVLTGAGESFFCAGADIAQLKVMTPDYKYNFCLHANETLQRLEQTPKLVIAALNGHCVGGGLEVALACDLRVAREGRAKIGLPEVKLGVLPGTGGTQRLTRIVGQAAALELMLTGRTFGVQEATELGLVHTTLPGETSEDFLREVRDYAKSFVPPEGASLAVGLIKRAVKSGAELPLSEALSLERELQQRLFCSADAKEGIAANREKRVPQFEGK